MSLGERLKLLRQQKGLMQKDVANAIGFSRDTVAKWEANARSKNPEVLQKFAEFYDVSIDYLLGNTDIPLKNEEQSILKTISDREDSNEIIEKLVETHGLNIQGTHYSIEEIKAMVLLIDTLQTMAPKKKN